ncbi:hypothetical protein AHF37_01966 [Paragonimus kellicotti]|nr:hypothetical protein AHF37_01966 [Paragonimus kellicotti]
MFRHGLLGADDDFATRNFYWENIFSSHYNSSETPPSWSLMLPFVAEMIFTKLASASKYLSFPRTMEQQNVFAFFNATDQIETTWLSGTDSPFRHIPPKIILQVFADFTTNDTIIFPVLVEALVQPPFVGYVSSVPIHSLSYGDIVYAEVTNMFDAKEQFVRNYPRLMTVNDSLRLVLFWNGQPSTVHNHAPQSTTVLLSLDSPSGQHCVTSLPINLTKNQQTQSAFAVQAVFCLSSHCVKCSTTALPLCLDCGMYTSVAQANNNWGCRFFCFRPHDPKSLLVG